MKFLLAILFTVFSTLPAHAVSYGISPVKNLQIGGRTFDKADLVNANIVYLMAQDTGTANYNTFRLWNGTAGYAVPGGQTLRIIGVVCDTQSASGQHSIKLLYGDTDSGFTGTVPTTPVYMAGSSAANAGICSLRAELSAQAESHTNFTVPTGKYPAFLGRGGPITVTLVGILE